jgi:hypothetical protein
MTTARDLVVEQLAQLAPGSIHVRPYARLSRQPARPTLLVRVDEIEPSDFAQLARVYKFSLIVLGTKLVTDDDTKGGVDDEIDDLAELVLSALDEGPTDVIWTSAKRGVYEPTDSPCYLIAAQWSGTYQPESETP